MAFASNHEIPGFLWHESSHLMSKMSKDITILKGQKTSQFSVSKKMEDISGQKHVGSKWTKISEFQVDKNISVHSAQKYYSF